MTGFLARAGMYIGRLVGSFGYGFAGSSTPVRIESVICFYSTTVPHPSFTDTTVPYPSLTSTTIKGC